MSKLKKGILSFAFAFIFLVGCNKVYAASTSLSASSYSVTPGTNVTISASVSATEAYNLKITASGGSLSGNINSADAFGAEKSATVLSANFSATAPGKYTITLSGNVTGSDLAKQTVNKSITITVNQPSEGNGGGATNSNTGNNSGSSSTSNGNNSVSTTTKDNNANLSNLGINPNDFRGFQSGKTEYSVNVPNDVTSINVYATKSSSKATVSGTGQKTLKEGTNRFDVTVVAEAGNKKTYTIIVNRAAENGEDIPNVIDEEPEEEEPSVGVGLESLVIEGLELDKEFKTDVYNYTVKTEDNLSLEDLENLKEKITANTNSDKVSKEVIAEISEDGKKTITIIIKDDEKEFSRYVITFEKEEKKDEESEPAVVLMTDSANPEEPTKGIFGLTPEQQIYALLACLGVTFLVAVYFACVAYLRGKRLAKYEENEDEEDENSEFGKMNEYYMGVQGGTEQNNIEEIEKDEFSEDTVSEVTSALGKLNGYRSLRSKSKSSGRHF